MNGNLTSRVPADHYSGLPGISITRLKEMRRSAQHFQYALEHPKESDALTLGTAAHCAVLEPERFDRQFAVWSRRSDKTGNLCPRNGQFWDKFQEENVGKSIITEDECSLALSIAAAVRADRIAAPYLAAGEPEVVMQWELDGRPCRGRVDWLTRQDQLPVVVGLKTARDCRPFQFGGAAARLGYHLQWAFYADGHQVIKGLQPKMIEIVVEAEPPHAVVVYEIPDDVLVQGRTEYEQLLEQLAECESTGQWPGPASAEQILTLPTWVYGQITDDISELGLESAA